MKSARIAAFFVALLVGGLFALSLLSVRGLQKLEAGPLVQRALDDPAQAEALVARAGDALSGDGQAGLAFTRYLLARSKPKLAVTLMRRVTTARDGARDPLAWGALALAARASHDNTLVSRADAEAKRLAETVLKGAGKATPGDKEALRRFQNAGLYLSERELGDEPKKAILALREALRLAPDDTEALNALGYTLADRGETPAERDEAVKLTRQALEKDPNSPMVLDSFGWALLQQGKDLPTARRALRQAVDSDIEEAEVRYHLAVVCVKLKLLDEARTELKRALLTNPNHAPSKALQAALGETPKVAP
jgi:tetratricopeptide (TPR) repeat protein